MPREDYYNDNPNMSRQRDFVLNMNEFAHILSKTDGNIKCAVGPFQTSLSQQEVPVIFNTKTKKFDECENYDAAKQLFISAPEGWYVVLKNPTADDRRPESSKSQLSPTSMLIGKKVNVFGPASFALYPGQMAKVIQGHRLRSNQYLMARVYDADAANKSIGVVTKVEETEGEEKTTTVTKAENTYFPGQLLIIKGTEVSFYIPPTGIEVLPVGGKGSEYVRDAVTLERLEYCMLKNENGNKRYVHGPAVVFPEPTETFIKTSDGNPRHRAIELSKISGIYIKVIAEYEENGVKHPLGEELFITGNDQMIYYPRAEHAIIQYDGKYMHHAIAIPNGEGRYIMERETGVINTVKGPQMLLPDPRTQVVVKRKLTDKQCQLWYPGNREVLEYNRGLNEKAVEKQAKALNMEMVNFCANSAFNDAAAMDFLESNANIARGISYTKPRTITLDNKYDGVVSIDVWTGYAIQVVSKGGKREVVVGPQTRLLDYDETLEYMSLSTGHPKTTGNILETAYLRVENNKISDLINVQTKDFVNVQVKVSYCVDFLEEYKDKWFSVENYVKYLCDHERSLIKRAAKNYTIEEFYANTADIVREIALDKKNAEAKDGVKGRLFTENGMLVKDVEVLSVGVEDAVAHMINKHQTDIISKNLELSNATARMDIVKKLDEYQREENKLKYENEQEKLVLESQLKLERLAKQADLDSKQAEYNKAMQEAQNALQTIMDEIAAKKLAREKEVKDEEIRVIQKKAEIAKYSQDAYAASVKDIMESVSPDLVAALESRANSDMLTTVAKSISPYAIAKDESVATFVDRLMRGTNLADMFKDVNITKTCDED